MELYAAEIMEYKSAPDSDSPSSSVAPHPEIQHIVPSSNSSPKFGRQMGATKPIQKNVDDPQRPVRIIVNFPVINKNKN